jgi:Domain of unknown function (DU1801)
MRKLTNEEAVAEYLHRLSHPLKNAVEMLRHAVLETNAEIGERIKWNALSFYYLGEMGTFEPTEREIVTFNLSRKDFILLVFPNAGDIVVGESVLEGNFPDGRRLAKFFSLDDAIQRRDSLRHIIRQIVGKK